MSRFQEGEFFGEVEGVGNLVTDGRIVIEPAEPAEVGEHRGGNLASPGWRETTLNFQFGAENGIGRLQAGTALNDVRGNCQRVVVHRQTVREEEESQKAFNSRITEMEDQEGEAEKKKLKGMRKVPYFI